MHLVFTLLTEMGSSSEQKLRVPWQDLYDFKGDQEVVGRERRGGLPNWEKKKV